MEAVDVSERASGHPWSGTNGERVSACRQDSRDRRQISSALVVLKTVSTAAQSWQLPLPLIEAISP
jgi:hypothetical protein